MRDTCLFEILALPEESLKRVLPKAPARVLARLCSAYPRTVRDPFMGILSKMLSNDSLRFLWEQVHIAEIPSCPLIQAAELELMKIIREEHLLPPASPSAPVCGREKRPA